jgi:hypothetical protein
MWILSRRIYNIVHRPTRILSQEIILAHAGGLTLFSVLGQRIDVKDKVTELALTVDHHNLTYSKDRTYYMHVKCCFRCQLTLAIQPIPVVLYLQAYSFLTLIRLWSTNLSPFLLHTSILLHLRLDLMIIALVAEKGYTARLISYRRYVFVFY